MYSVDGPESTGSFPGPVCYGLGGDKATLTDAFVTAGLIDPEYFLGGSKRLALNAAHEATASHVARPRKASVEGAATMVIDQACDMVASLIAKAGKELGQDMSDHYYGTWPDAKSTGPGFRP